MKKSQGHSLESIFRKLYCGGTTQKRCWHLNLECPLKAYILRLGKFPLELLREWWDLQKGVAGSQAVGCVLLERFQGTQSSSPNCF